MNGMWYLIADSPIPETSIADCSLQDTQLCEEALAATIHGKWQSLNSTHSRTSFDRVASLAPVYWPITSYSYSAFKIGKEIPINHI
jgi:hypothetical protein